MEKVSIIIPVYNVENELAECIESVLNQTYKNIEVILVNDGSTDNSFQIVTEYANMDSRILVINQKNQGPAAARNNGLKASNGDYITFVDSDDWIESCFIEKMMKLIHETNADLVECGYKEIKDKDDINFKSYPKKYDIITDSNEIIMKHLAGDISFLVWNKLYRSRLVKEIYFEEGTEYEDVLWSCAVLKKTYRVAAVREPMYNWRLRTFSISRRNFSEKRFTALDRFNTRIDMLKNYSEEVKRLARARIIIECYLELREANNTSDRELMVKAQKHSNGYYKKHKLSLIDFIKLRTLNEKVRYIYYFIHYKKAMSQNVKMCGKMANE